MNRETFIAYRLNGGIPALPRVAEEILAVARRPETNLRDLDELMVLDEEFSGTVMRMANSAFFCHREPLSDLREVIVLLGVSSLRSLVLAACLQSVYRSVGPRLRELSMWEHAVAAAIAARSISLDRSDVDPEDAFVGGLVHDIGKVVLDEEFGDDYERVIERVYAGPDSFVEAEADILGIQHAEVGALVAERWGLSRAIREAVRLHHRPADSAVNAPLCAVVSLADSLCGKLEIGPYWRPDLDLSILDSSRMLAIDPGRLECISRRLPHSLRRDSARFGADWPLDPERSSEPAPPRSS